MNLQSVALNTRKRLDIPINVPVLENYEVEEINAAGKGPDNSLGFGVLTVFDKCIAFASYQDPVSLPKQIFFSDVKFIGQKEKNSGVINIGFVLGERRVESVVEFATKPRIDQELIDFLNFLIRWNRKLLDPPVMELIKRMGFTHNYMVQLAKYYTQTTLLASYGAITCVNHKDPRTIVDPLDDPTDAQLKLMGYNSDRPDDVTQIEVVIGQFHCSEMTVSKTPTIAGGAAFQEISVIVTRNMVVVSAASPAPQMWWLDFNSVTTVVPERDEAGGLTVRLVHFGADGTPDHYIFEKFDERTDFSSAVLLENSWLMALNKRYNIYEPHREDRGCLHLEELRGIFESFKAMDSQSDGTVDMTILENEVRKALPPETPDLLQRILYGGLCPGGQDEGPLRMPSFLRVMRCLIVGSIFERAGYMFRCINISKTGTLDLQQVTEFVNTIVEHTGLDPYTQRAANGIWEALVPYANTDGGEYQFVDAMTAVSVLGDTTNPTVDAALKSIKMRYPVVDLRPSEGRKLIFPGHRLWGLTQRMMKGITISTESRRPTTSTSVTAYNTKVRFDFNQGLVISEELYVKLKKTNPPDWFVWTEYASETFKEIREQLRWTNEEYLRSIGHRGVLSGFLSGRWRGLCEVTCSSQQTDFLMMTHDERLVLRFLSQSESLSLRDILRNYHLYILANRRTSFITKLLGMYSIQYQGKKVTFVVMTNAFMNSRKQLHQIFSLKGLEFGRSVPPAQRHGAMPLKDYDFRKRAITMHAPVRNSLMMQLQQDVSFLCKNGVVDYTLLIGVHTVYFDLETPEAEDLADTTSPFTYALDEIKKKKRDEELRIKQEKEEQLAREEAERLARRLPRFPGPLPGWKCQACGSINPIKNDFMCKHCYVRSPNVKAMNEFWTQRVQRPELKKDPFAHLAKLVQLPIYKDPDDEGTRKYTTLTRNPDVDSGSSDSEEEVDRPDKKIYQPRPLKPQARVADKSPSPTYVIPPNMGPIAPRLMRHLKHYEDSMVGDGAGRIVYQSFFGGTPGLMHNSTNPAIVPLDMEYTDIFFVGIVDIFTQFGSKRTNEGLMNSILSSFTAPKAQVTIVAGRNDIPPEEYRKRIMTCVANVWH